MPKKLLESDLYPIVERWMRRHFNCFKTAIDKGLRYGRIDVLGIRDVGGDLSGEVETIAIEVKKGNTPFAKASGQTLGYRVYTNRVYLADYRQEAFTTDEIHIASNLGIGLIEIRGRTCKEVLSSPHYQPITKLNLSLLESVAIGRCQTCGSFFETGNSKLNRHSYTKLTSVNMKQAILKERGLMFWNYEAAYRKNKFNLRRAKKGIAYERRFICPECVEVLFAPLLDNSE
ncbi:MAG: hypothetical protein H7Z38_17140 [Rubrivivax sp.]|nr:hypothetical protein [Pyrinomonadaceae bacterium]